MLLFLYLRGKETGNKHRKKRNKERTRERERKRERILSSAISLSNVYIAWSWGRLGPWSQKCHQWLAHSWQVPGYLYQPIASLHWQGADIKFLSWGLNSGAFMRDRGPSYASPKCLILLAINIIKDVKGIDQEKL